jgi:AraC-like DNA-binding protein
MHETPGAGLKEIAALCNFPDIATFSKAYKRCF